MSNESFLRQTIGAFLCVWMIVAAPNSVDAQDYPTSTKADTPTNQSSSKESSVKAAKAALEAALPTPAWTYLLDGAGKAIAIPGNANLDEYLEFVKNPPQQLMPNLATINDIEIDGKADDDRARLKVTYTIRLQQPDQWVRIPLILTEAVLAQPPTYEGGDGCGYEFDPKDAQEGHFCWLKGRGPHRLELSVIVPMKKNARRLVLSLPTVPSSRARIVVPHASVSAKVSREQSDLTTESLPEGKTLIKVIDLGSPRFELTWNPTQEILNEVLLESQTTIRAQIEPESVQINAEQTVSSLQGPFKQIVVRLPMAAESIQLGNPEKQTFVVDSKEKNLVTVKFVEKVQSAQLMWSLKIPSRILTPLTIDGFMIEGKGTRKQDGRIGLWVSERLRPLSEPRDSSVVSIDVGEFPTTLGTVTKAYRFHSQPFKLSFTLENVKPYYQVNPLLYLEAYDQRLMLDGLFEYRVDRESVTEVTLNWPDHKSEGWIIDRIDDPSFLDKPGVVEGFTIDEKGQIGVRLVKAQAGVFSFHLHARRNLRSNDETSFTLPRPKSASRLAPTFLVLANSENVETDLMTRGETFMQQLPASFLKSDKLPESSTSLKAAAYRIDTDEQSFALRVTPQQRRIRTESLLEVNWRENQLEFDQTLIYQVSYERLSQIRVTLPPEIDADKIRFTIGPKNELVSEVVATQTGNSRQIQLKLPKPQKDRFEVHAKFSIPLPKESAGWNDGTLTLPILQSADEAFSETQVSLGQTDWFDAEPTAPGIWRSRSNQTDAWLWAADGNPASMLLKLSRSTQTKGTGTVSHALITTRLDGAATELVRAELLMSSRSSSISVNLPPTSDYVTFYWDDREWPGQKCVESKVEPRQYTIDLSDLPEGARMGEHLLTIEYRNRFNAPLGSISQLELRPPQLPKCQWYAQVVWQAVLPSGQHLFTYPATATPLFRWQRSGLVWTRTSDTAVDELRKSVYGSTARPESKFKSQDRTSNVYAFSQFGAPRTLLFQTMNSQMVVFLGASFSLVIGFMLWRLVVLRHVLTLLVMGVAIATVGLWYSAPLELLIQPMIAGLVFPLTAIFLESWIRRNNESPLMAFESPVEFPPMQAFSSNFVVRQSDPNEATVHRPVSVDGQSNLGIEAGSGVS